MAKSSGIPYFCGEQLAHNGRITSMVGSVQPIMKVYPRTIGGVIKAGGTNDKVITVECGIISPPDATRAQVEEMMNTLNEKFGPKVGTLLIDDNEYLNCAINTITYDTDLTDGYLKFTIDFHLGVQEDGGYRQLTPSHLFYDSRGRVGIFQSQGKTFHIVHNIDITRNLENRLDIEVADKNDKDKTIKFNGGFEMVTGYCWMKAAEEYQEDGWRQTVGAYIYDIMTGPLGDIGTLTIDTMTIKNCLFTSVKLLEVYPTSARYQLEFIVSLQC